MSSVRVTGLVVDHLSALLSKVLRFEGPADAVMSRYFKQHHKLGNRDRSLVAEATFAALRHYGTLQWQMQPAHPARAPRLAALVTLARQHGFGALDPRTLRSDDRAVRHAAALRTDNAPAAVRAEVPLWLFRLVTAQYHDAEALFAALSSAAPLDNPSEAVISRYIVPSGSMNLAPFGTRKVDFVIVVGTAPDPTVTKLP